MSLGDKKILNIKKMPVLPLPILVSSLNALFSFIGLLSFENWAAYNYVYNGVAARSQMRIKGKQNITGFLEML